MKYCKGVVITGENTMAVSDCCPVPEEPCPTGALIRPLIWSPCTSDAHLCATGCASLPYLVGKAMGHEMCGEITKVGAEVQDFHVGDRVIVCAVMPHWRSLEAQDGWGKQRQDNLYAGVDDPERGGSFVEEYYIRDADMNLAHIPEGVTLEQAVMVPDMMCTAFEGVRQLDPAFGASVAVLGIGPVGLMAVRAAVLRGAGKVFAIGSRKGCFEVAQAYGATHLVDYHHEDYLQQILAANGGPVDGVVLCGGGEAELSKGLSLLKKGGHPGQPQRLLQRPAHPHRPRGVGLRLWGQDHQRGGLRRRPAVDVLDGPAHRLGPGGAGKAHHPPLPRAGPDPCGHGPLPPARPQPHQAGHLQRLIPHHTGKEVKTMEYAILNNGIKMPMAGIGTFLLSPDEAESAVLHALEDGYRLIDTANAYLNEKAVGRAMQGSGLKREDIFLETKLWPSFYQQADAVDKTLARLGTDYIDLLLIHQPAGNYVAGCRPMEAAYKEGKVRAIGLSNFSQAQIQEILSLCEVKPTVLQTEAHPYSQKKELKGFLENEGIVLQAWYPLGHGDKTLLEEPLFAQLGQKYGKTSAQVILRWHIQDGNIVIPGSKNPGHIRDNFALFDFALTDQEMAQIAALDRQKNYYTSTPELLRQYVAMVPPVDSQK